MSHRHFFLFSSEDGRDPVYTEDGEYESVTSSEDEKGTFKKIFVVLDQKFNCKFRIIFCV